jgi:flagellar biogenesis protein FliO
MPVETVGLTQIITVVIFLGLLLAALAFVKRHRAPIAERLHGHKRVQIVNDISLGVAEKLKIIRIDDRDYVVISAKGQASQLFALPTTAAGFEAVQAEEAVA